MGGRASGGGGGGRRPGFEFGIGPRGNINPRRGRAMGRAGTRRIQRKNAQEREAAFGDGYKGWVRSKEARFRSQEAARAAADARSGARKRKEAELARYEAMYD